MTSQACGTELQLETTGCPPTSRVVATASCANLVRVGRMIRSLRAIVRSPAPVLAAMLIACAGQPSQGYVPFRNDATPELEARSTCQERAKFRDGRGIEWIDWTKFATCMEEHGYRKP